MELLPITVLSNTSVDFPVFLSIVFTVADLGFGIKGILQTRPRSKTTPTFAVRHAHFRSKNVQLEDHPSGC